MNTAHASEGNRTEKVRLDVKAKVKAEDPVLNQVHVDLNEYLKNSGHVKKTLKFISKKIGVHEKTLLRIWSLENKPTYVTVYRLYKFLLNEPNDAKLLDRAPTLIKEYLKKANPQKIDQRVSYIFEAEEDLKQNPVMGELYILSGTGPLLKSDVLDRFGRYGLEVLEQMLKLKLLVQSKPDQYSIGTAQVNMSPELILNLGQLILKNYAKPENGFEKGRHFMSFYAESLSDEAYDKWLQIDQEAYNKKVELAQKSSSLGSKKAFTFTCVDTLQVRKT